MANLLDIRRRIKSVKNTQQITKAMKMVSAAKLKRAQDRVVNARPFANKMKEVLGELASQTSEDFHHPLLDQRGDQRYLVVLVTADKGLCGAFNANLIKAGQSFVKQNPDKTIEWVTVGRKGRDFFRRRADIANEYVGMTGKGRVEFSEALEVAHDVIKRFTEDKEIDKVFLIFAEFKSVLTQRVVTEQILPISRKEEEGGKSIFTEIRGMNSQQLEEFMARPWFGHQYNALSNSAYVDSLLQNAGVTLPSRESLINGLNNATFTRAQVLRQIADSPELRQGPESAQTKDYIYEQPPAEIFSRLLPRLVETQIFRALLESIASEQGARMTAMDAASKNAGELISSLTLNMNRVRQAAITREIIEIVSGAAAL